MGCQETGCQKTGLPEDGLPEDGLPEVGLPEDRLPEDGLTVKKAGLSDLVIEVPNRRADKHVTQMKFSGNSLRITRNALLYHGTVLYDFSLSLISELLRLPPRQPTYRGDRAHDQFITNLPIDVATIRTAIQRKWMATNYGTKWPKELMKQLADEKYSRDEWNRRH